MRGKVTLQDVPCDSVGITPRVCGEKCHSRLSAASAEGSPPRMRGKVVKEVTGQTATRITPAYAGKSSSRGVRTCFEKDHPRVCGEKRSQSTSASRRAGSPPRMRGKARSACFHLRNLGITPAYAGKRHRAKKWTGQSGDHPRVCGEKARCICSGVGSKGSPPRMRGKGARTHSAAPAAGITPAYAGKRVCLD